MRAFECLITQPGRQALLEALLASGYPVRLRRIENAHGVKEEWRVGSSIRNEWCVLWKEETARWKATFGGNFKWPVVLEAAFLKIVDEIEDCSWIWPEKWNDKRE